MEYQKTIKLLHKVPNQPSRFRTKNRVEINEDSRGTYNFNNQIRFKTSMLKWYSDAYVLVSGTITITRGAKMLLTRIKEHTKEIKEVTLENCASFIECRSKTMMPK